MCWPSVPTSEINSDIGCYAKFRRVGGSSRVIRMSERSSFLVQNCLRPLIPDTGVVEPPRDGPPAGDRYLQDPELARQNNNVPSPIDQSDIRRRIRPLRRLAHHSQLKKSRAGDETR